MLRYVTRRLMMLIGIVFVISVGSFYLIHLLPGQPCRGHPRTWGDAPRTRRNLYKQLGLNRPIYEQYFIWISNVVRGNLGTSFISQTSVADTIRLALTDRPRDHRPEPDPGLRRCYPDGYALGAQARRHHRPDPRRR